MAFKTDYLKQKVLDHVWGNTAYTIPTTLYVRLYTDTNTQLQHNAGTFTEPSTNVWTNYTGLSITNNTTTWSNASATPVTKSNGIDFIFPAATITSGSITVYGMMLADAAVGGNILAWAPFIGAEKVLTAATSDTCTSPAHGFSDTNRVLFSKLATGGVPTGLTDGAYYYIKASTTDTFELSLTGGGATINITASGVGKIGLYGGFTVSNGQVVTIAATAVSLVEN